MDFQDYQYDIRKWCIQCFGEEIFKDKIERAFRFLEESLELVQSLGVTQEQALQLVDYVFNRPVGDPVQEVGGTIVTLTALCETNGISLNSAAQWEYERILKKVDKIRAKHLSKPKNIISPLPGVSPEEKPFKYQADGL